MEVCIFHFFFLKKKKVNDEIDKERVTGGFVLFHDAGFAGEIFIDVCVYIVITIGTTAAIPRPSRLRRRWSWGPASRMRLCPPTRRNRAVRSMRAITRGGSYGRLRSMGI